MEPMETLELNPVAKKALINRINRKLRETYDLMTEDIPFDLETIDLKQAMHDMVDTMIPIPDYGIQINVYDVMSSMVHVMMKDKAKVFRQVIVKTIEDAIDSGKIKLLEVKDDKEEEETEEG